VVAPAALLAARAVQARESRFKTGLEESGHPAQWAAGLTLGDPFGFTLKRYLGGADAIDFNIALAHGPGFRVGVDWLWGLGRLHRHPKFNLDLYFGVGLILDFLLALRLLV
jgi:hypothetical protein